MTAPRVSLSGLPRVMQCLLSALLPHTHQEGPSEDRDRGTAIHTFVARIGDVGVEAALSEVPEEHRAACAVIDVAALPHCRPDDYAREVAFRWNPETGEAREVGRMIGRAYPPGRGPMEMDGTLDIVGLADDQVAVLDVKTGWGALGEVAAHWQLRGGACLAAAAYKRDAATIGFIRLVDGEPWFQRAHMDAMDLAADGLAVADLLRRLQTADPAQLEPVEGEHCRYCPAFDSCPAKQALARQLATITPEEGGAITTGNAAKVYGLLSRAQGVLDTIEVRLKEFARATPFDLPDGQVYGVYEKRLGDAVDIAGAEEVLGQRYGPETGAALVEAATIREPKWVKGKFTDALRPIVKARGARLGSEEKAVYRALEAAGASKPKVSVLIGPHKPKKLKVGETPTERVGISGELQAREAPQDAEPGAEG